MGKSCKSIARELFDCLEGTECVKSGGKIKECMKTVEGNDQCGALRRGYFECKRGGLDMRYRIRGPKSY